MEMGYSNNINYFPGHMAKTKREIKEVIDLIDIVYEVVDARIPFSSKIKDVDDLIKNKRKILIMTKKDLCNINETNKWINYYTNNGYKVLCLDLNNNDDYKKIVNVTNELVKDLQDKRESKGLKKKEIKALVIGIPNVGKSTLINRLVGKNVANVQNKPGVTKNLNFLSTRAGIVLLDTPGILWPKMDNQDVAMNIASVGSIKKEILNMTDVLYYLVSVYHNSYKEVFDYYKVDDNDDIDTIINDLARRFSFIKNDEIDYNRLADKVYNDFVSGRVKNITLDICK